MSDILDWQLTEGVLPVVITAVGALAGVLLLARWDRRWWVRTVPIVAIVSVLVCLLLWWVVEGLWRPFPDSLPFLVLAWFGAAVVATGLAVARLPGSRWRHRIASAVAAMLVILTAGAQLNVYFGHFPSLRSAFGLPPVNEIPFNRINAAAPDPPRHGAVAQVAIPSRQPTFTPTRNGYVYVPPAYQLTPRPALPVLVLLHGQPGGPSDWINGGQLAAMMDRYAQAHHGFAPVVVVPDATGAVLGNPLCLDSRLGNSESYLTKDVPDWIKQHLHVASDSRNWAVAGYSYGGTCALQLALRKPDVFPTFIDISGQDEPTLGTRARTVRAAFGGDESAFRAVNPMDLLRANKYPGSAGMITVGASDRTTVPQQRRVFEAATRNGLSVAWRQVPGSHNWQAWAAGLSTSLDWLADRIGLTCLSATPPAARAGPPGPGCPP